MGGYILSYRYEHIHSYVQHNIYTLSNMLNCINYISIKIDIKIIRLKKETPRSLGLFRELTLTLKDIEKTSSVGDQLRDPKLPPYGSLYRGIATYH